MKVISVLSAKGGVGKTSLALGLSTALANEGRQVLMCDLDGFNRTLSNAFYEPDRHDIQSVLMTGLALSDAAYAVRDNLFLVNGSAALTEVDEPHVAQAWRRFPDVVVTLPEIYDYVVIDCPAGWHLPCRMAAIAALQAGESGLNLTPVAPSLESLESANATTVSILSMLNNDSLTSHYGLDSDRSAASERLKYVLTMRPSNWSESEDAGLFPELTAAEVSWLESSIPFSVMAPKIAKASQTPFDNPAAWALRRSYTTLAQEIESLFE